MEVINNKYVSTAITIGLGLASIISGLLAGKKA